MREWWQYHVEDRLDRLSINWDKVFLYTWLSITILAILSGGRSV